MRIIIIMSSLYRGRNNVYHIRTGSKLSFKDSNGKRRKVMARSVKVKTSKSDQHEIKDNHEEQASQTQETHQSGHHDLQDSDCYLCSINISCAPKCKYINYIYTTSILLMTLLTSVFTFKLKLLIFLLRVDQLIIKACTFLQNWIKSCQTIFITSLKNLHFQEIFIIFVYKIYICMSCL